MRIAITLLSTLFLHLASLPTQAAAIDYFAAEIPVSSQSREAQAEAARSGLLDVLVRVSGSEEVRENEFILERSKNALSFVSQFQFSNVDDIELEAEGYSHLLQLKYSGRLLRKLLTEAQLPVWSTNRPRTLVWIVEDNLEQGKQMLTYDSSSPLFAGLKEAVEYRGLPLDYPLLDFEDQLSLGAEKLWLLDEQAILNASERYGADSILVGKYSQMSSGYVLSSWQFFHRGKTSSYDLRAENIQEIGYESILPLADFLASQYSYSAADSEYFSLSIQNVATFADYRGLVKTLKSLDTISEVKVDRVEGDLIALRLKSEASLDQVMTQLDLGRKLLMIDTSAHLNVPEWELAERGSPQNPLSYRWQR